MPASLIHLIRHGEVYNPDRILYGRLPAFGLSDLGHRMAAAASEAFDGHPIVRLYSSPLQRTQESAAPWAEKFGLEIHTDDRLIEPTNKFEGTSVRGANLLTRPEAWPWMVNPLRPSWGEPYASIAERMLAAIEDAWEATDGGDVALVTHQLPIWMMHRTLAGERLYHDPRKRRCTLSSVTTLEKRGNRFVEVGYQDPARELAATATDLGAV